jgi:predicted esterase
MRYTKYWIMDNEINTLYNQNKYKEALTILEKASKYLLPNEFEKYQFNIMSSKAIFYCLEQRFEEAISILDYLIGRGFACDDDIFKMLPMKEDIRYIELKTKNDIHLGKAREDAKPKHIVYTPENYTSEKKYPLFLGLHGDPGNIDEFSEYWKPDEFLRNGFIVGYIQSSQLLIQGGYGWLENLSISRKEIKECYNKVLQQYSIDSNCVIIGGFSGGAIAAIEVTLSNIIPIKGFIALGPELTESFTKENVKLAADRGVKGVLMEGEVLMPLPEQEEMVSTFKECEFPYEFLINQGIGHAVPQDLPNKLNQAIKFICSC